MKNFLFTIIAIFLFSTIFFSSLNFFLGGVPLFSLFNIDTSDAVYVLKKKKNKSDYKISFNYDYYVDHCGKSENGFYNLAYKQDRFGFRENYENLFYKTDIVLLGDSFGISSCVNYPNDLTTKLIKKTNNKNILNISAGGTGPFYQKEMMIALFKKNNTKFNTFVWLFYEGNDHQDLNTNYGQSIDFTFKTNYNNSDIEVNYIPSSNVKFIKIKLFFSNYFRGFGTLAKYFKSYPKLLPYPVKYDDVVKHLNEFLIENGVKNKILFYIPKYTRLAYKDIKHPQLKQLNDLKNFVEITSLKYGFKFIDGSQLLHNKRKPLDIFHYNLPTHFNIKGYDLLANELSRFLKD